MRQAPCHRCGRTAWVNVMTPLDGTGGAAGVEVCGDCWDLIPHPEPNRNRTVKSSGSGEGAHNDPGFDNVVRAMEQDR